MLAAGCATRVVEPEPVPASQTDVSAALYRQLELVLERCQALEGEDDEAARREREELQRLASEIAVRIVRIDPQADIRRLVEQIEAAR